jgi:hypothetical protein
VDDERRRVARKAKGGSHVEGRGMVKRGQGGRRRKIEEEGRWWIREGYRGEEEERKVASKR